LLEKGYSVCGVVRTSDASYDNLAGLVGRIDVVECDLLDQASLAELLDRHHPHEVYNLAAPSFVPLSWELPVRTAEFAAVGVTTMLEAIRTVDPAIRFYQASSSEIFGEPTEVPQTERTPLAPLTPYGVAKAYGHFITRSYRKRYELHACSGILFNHESPRRPRDFVTRKVTSAAAAISLELEHRFSLGNLDAQRDWSYAGDAVRAMWLMLQQDESDDYVIASGRLRSVRDLLDVAFGYLELDWREFVDVDPALHRGRAELQSLVGDTSKARERLGWAPTVSFEMMIRMMVDADLERLGRASSDT
jgi:GDPmannose 4,6-dehydratase